MILPVEHPSPNRRARPPGAVIDTLVLHYTGMRSAAEAIARLCDPAAAVSSHYVVDEDGTIFRLVAEDERAAHAGVSAWRGVEGLNETSIGIEIVNPGHEWGYRAFPEAQVAQTIALCRDIVARRGIDARSVVGHSDIAPDRKQDPGELFPWRRLAAAGVGLWPDAPVGSLSEPAETALRRIGYRIDGTRTLPLVVAAFQRHWRPARVDGVIDDDTAAAIAAVAAAGD